MSENDSKLDQLIAAARRASEAPPEAPYGFATRVVARAFAEGAPAFLRNWERLSFRFLVCSVVAMLLGLGAAQAIPVTGDLPSADALTAEIVNVGL